MQEYPCLELQRGQEKEDKKDEKNIIKRYR